MKRFILPLNFISVTRCSRQRLECSAAAFPLPIVMPDGIHVLYMVKNLRPVPFDFAAAREQVLNDCRNEAIAHLKTSDESFLRKRANVLIADDVR